MKYKAIIVDDEYRVRDVFMNLLNHYCSEIEIVGQADNINDAYNLILKEKPQVVFLDIEMPHGNGFELLQKFIKPPFEVIFVTSYGHYAIRAIKYSALDYILKPVMVSDLQGAIIRLKERIEEKNESENFSILQENLNPMHLNKRIVVQTKNKTQYLYFNEILYLEADGNYTTIYLENSKIYVAKTLKEYDDLLCDGESPFSRIHKTYIVNTNFIEKIHQGESNSVVLKNNTNLEVSRRKKQELLEKMS